MENIFTFYAFLQYVYECLTSPAVYHHHAYHCVYYLIQKLTILLFSTNLQIKITNQTLSDRRQKVLN